MSEARSYYDVFEEWITNKYLQPVGETYCWLLRFELLEQKWFLYEAGVYRQVYQQQIRHLYTECMDHFQIPTSTQRKTHCLQRLEELCGCESQWMDWNSRYECVENGVIDLEERVLLAHSPLMPFRYKIPRIFDPNVDPVIPSLFHKAIQTIADKEDRDNFLKFCLAFVHKRFDYQLFLILYGAKGAGKSTLLQIFEKMVGSAIMSKKALNEFGKRFSLANVYDKRLNSHPDMPMIDFDPFSISTIKTLTGEDGLIEIEGKGKPIFLWEIKLFLAGGYNRLPWFNRQAENEIDSVLRRAVLCETPTMQRKDSAFRNSLVEPKFLNELYSWMVMTNPIPLFTADDQETYILRNRQKWMWNANPILKILAEEYEYCEGAELRAYDVVEYVRHQLEEEGQIVPKELKTQITQALSTMNIFPNTQRGANAKYQNIIPRFDKKLEEMGIEVLNGGDF